MVLLVSRVVNTFQKVFSLLCLDPSEESTAAVALRHKGDLTGQGLLDPWAAECMLGQRGWKQHLVLLHQSSWSSDVLKGVFFLSSWSQQLTENTK